MIQKIYIKSKGKHVDHIPYANYCCLAPLLGALRIFFKKNKKVNEIGKIKGDR